jgi:hypothetical protein
LKRKGVGWGGSASLKGNKKKRKKKRKKGKKKTRTGIRKLGRALKVQLALKSFKNGLGELLYFGRH